METLVERTVSTRCGDSVPRLTARFSRREAWALFGLTAIGLIAVLIPAAGWAQKTPAQATTQVSIVGQPLPDALVGRPYNFQLTATGGVPSYTWPLAQGSGPLPPGLQLDPKLGVISGVPSAGGEFKFSLAVTDSGGPQAQDMKSFVINVPSALTLDWKQFPKMKKEGITGAVVVSNQTGQTVDLTVIIVAVNEVGKAFALADQHFPLKPQTDSPIIPFGTDSTLPYGKYIIHADAVGEVASAKQIYRTRKQTAEAFVIKQQ
jgi:hypothetical protein